MPDSGAEGLAEAQGCFMDFLDVFRKAYGLPSRAEMSEKEREEHAYQFAFIAEILKRRLPPAVEPEE